MRSFLPRGDAMLEPPSPESRENPLESGAPVPGSSPDKPHSSPSTPMIQSVEMPPDPKSTSDNPTSPERNRRTIGEWFRTIIMKRSHNRPLRQTPSAPRPPESGIPSQTEATPPNEKPSMSPGRRQKVSVPFSIDTGHGYLTTQLSGRLEGPLPNERLVHTSYPL